MKRLKTTGRPYADNWNRKCYQARKVTKNRCCRCFKEAELVHHAMYAKRVNLVFFKPIYGSEISGRHIFPVCRKCHGFLHSKKNWISADLDPVKHKNTKKIIFNLKIGFLICKYCPLILLELISWLL